MTPDKDWNEFIKSLVSHRVEFLEPTPALQLRLIPK